MRTLIQEL